MHRWWGVRWQTIAQRIDGSDFTHTPARYQLMFSIVSVQGRNLEACERNNSVKLPKSMDVKFTNPVSGAISATSGTAGRPIPML